MQSKMIFGKETWEESHAPGEDSVREISGYENLGRGRLESRGDDEHRREECRRMMKGGAKRRKVTSR